ncbi:MAG: transcriptional regulator [Moorea sp. SIO2B7]|nr:transcriptional regulator [Moorena sp. SIO2B7]
MYGQLLAKFQPQVITTENENKRAISLAKTLANKPELNPEEEQLLELLLTLIEKFEAENYNLENISIPLSRLLFLMESNNISQSDLEEIFGSKEITSEVIQGKRSISQQTALKLGKKFNIAPGLFLF